MSEPVNPFADITDPPKQEDRAQANPFGDIVDPPKQEDKTADKGPSQSQAQQYVPQANPFADITDPFKDQAAKPPAPDQNFETGATSLPVTDRAAQAIDEVAKAVPRGIVSGVGDMASFFQRHPEIAEAMAAEGGNDIPLEVREQERAEAARADGEFGKGIKAWGQKQFPVGKGYEDSMAVQIPEGLAEFTTGLVGGPATLFAQGAQQAHEKAVQAGAKPEQSDTAEIAGGLTNAVMGAVPEIKVLESLAPAARQGVLGFALRNIETGTAMGVINTLGAAINNAVERYTYDPEGTVSSGLVEAASLGFVQGLLFHSLLHEPFRKPHEAAPPDAPPADTPTAAANENQPDRAAPIQTFINENIAPHETPEAKSAAIDEAASSANTEPSEGQKATGNYAKGHEEIDGIQIAIENPRGSVREGTDANGNPYSSEQPDHYGYIKGTVGTGPARVGNVAELTTGELKSWLKSGDTRAPMAGQDFHITTADAPRPLVPLGGSLWGDVRPTELYSEHEHGLIQAVSDLLARIAPGAKSRPAASITSTSGGKPFLVNGAHLAGMIHWAFNSDSPFSVLGTARHEAIHYLKEAKVFTDREWGTLVDAASRHQRGDTGETFQEWADRMYPDKPGLDPKEKAEARAGRQEEAVAEMYAGWAHAQQQVRGPIGRALYKLDLMRRRIVSAVQSVLGRQVSADHLFSQVESGKIGARQGENGPVRMEPQLHAADHGSGAGNITAYDNERLGSANGLANGWGHYFGGLRSTAREYAIGSGKDRYLFKGQDVRELPVSNPMRDPISEIAKTKPERREQAIQTVLHGFRALLEQYERAPESQGAKEYKDQLVNTIKQLESAKPEDFDHRVGYVYENEIHNDEDHYLHLDKPLSEQTGFVKAALEKIEKAHPGVFDGVSDHSSARSLLKAGEDALGPREWSEALLKAGVQGNKYYDGYSHQNSFTYRGERFGHDEKASYDEVMGVRALHEIGGTLPETKDPKQLLSAAIDKAERLLKSARDYGGAVKTYENRLRWLKELDPNELKMIDPTHNYVVFDPSKVEIIARHQRRDEEPGPGHNGGPPMKVPGVRGLTNPLPTPRDFAAKVARAISRKPDVGAPSNDATRIGKGVYFGKVSLPQWVDRVENNLTPAEVSEARRWYADALPAYEAYFGPEKAPAMLGAWLTANRNATPGFAQLSAVRTAEQYMNRSGEHSDQKQGGLAHEQLMRYWDAIMSDDLSKLGQEGSGQKIYDLIDSGLGKTTRTFYGDDPRAGAPAVADVHSLRDMGFVDQATINWVRSKYGDKAADKLSRDSEGLSPSEAQYEWAADKMRDFADRLNKRKYMGGGWTPAEVQAVGWTAMSKMLDRKPQTASQAIEANIRNLSYELDFGSGAPYNDMFPEWHGFSPDQKADVSRRVLPMIIDEAKDITKAHIFSNVQGLGGWHEMTNAAFKTRLIASPEVAGDMADIIGYLGQQTKVFGYRWQASGNRLGLAIYGDGLQDPKIVGKMWGEIVRKHPDFAAGFSPSIDAGGVPGIEMLFDKGGKKMEARIGSELEPAITEIAQRLGVKFDIYGFRAQEESREHDWTEDPEGRGYISRLRARYGSQVPERLELFKREKLEPEIRAAIDAQAGTEGGVDEQPSGGTEPEKLSRRGELSGGEGSVEARGAADQEDGGARPLEGLPRRVSIPGGGTIEAGPSPRAKSAAADYMASTGRAYDPPRDYVKVDPERAARIASAFEEMKDDPTDPRVLASYKAMIDETLAQWEAIKKTGLHVEFIKGEDPYAASPRLAIEDVNRNNHLWVFPTDAGYGSSEIMAHEIERNPLLALTGETISGQPARANDIFRIVHDYFGHIKEGVGFRADGEENAWRQHAAMYSDLARGAMTTETRGQNSWLNFGPHGEANRTAKSDETVFADQKIGLMPKWVEDEGRFQRREETETPEFKAWFGGSKVVDANGDPQVLYHGTITHGSDKEFGNVDVFDRNFAKNYFGRKSSFNEVGSWFSSKPDKSGAGMYSGASGGHIYPVFVRIENPKETSLSQLIRTARRLAGLDPDRAPNGKPIGVFDPEPYRKWLKDNGYDGIRLTRDESGELSKQDVWVALEPNQIKSATGNSGAFDRNNPDIRFQRRRTPQEIDADERVRLAKVANRVALISKPWDALMSTGPVKNLMAGDAYAKSAEAWKSFSRAVKLFADPMTVGGFDPARAAAKDFMNQQRRIQYAYSKLDDMILNGAVDKQTGRRITNGFSAAERKLMWEATDEQSVFEQKLKADLANVAPADQAAYEAQARQGFAGRGLDRLTGDQRAVAEMLNNLAQATWKRLYDAGIVRGEEGLPYYMPRQFVKDVGANGKFERIDAPGGEGGNSSLDKIGGNLQGAGIKSRKHLEVSDTEAAAKAKLGNDAEIVKDVRVLLLALSRAEKGIAGRSLVDSIKALGKLAGATTVQDHEGSEFFTIDHPALKKWGPDFEQDANGKWVPRLDANGQPIMVQKPIYIHRSFEGPLRAVLSKPPGMIYSALMQAKTFGTTMVMLSPFIHLSVIMGKAFPMMRGKMLTMHFWKEGSLALRDDDTMKEAISHGYVPIGHGGFRQDITGIANEPGSRPGNSIIAKGTGLLGRPFGMAAEDAIRNGVDKVGHFVHGTLLWDRIAQLQAGIYTTIRDKYMDAGYSRDAAAYAAAHIANRYAGVLPKEAMGDLAGKVANVMMFSRSFTLGNLGIMKDMGVGLPMDVRSQMKRDIPGLMGSSMSAQIRRKSIGGFVADIAMLYAMNAALQTGIQMLWHDQTLDDVAKGFIDRANRLGQRVAEHPLDMINPFDMADSIMPGGDNEPGKESRIYIGRDETGRAMYFRNAFGKIGEEFKGWLTTPLTMMHNKSSTLVKPLLQIWQNDKGFGQQVFTPSEGGVTGNIKTLGQAVGHFMKSQMGTTGDIGSSVYDMFDGVIDSNHKVDKVAAIKAWLPILTGLTVSQGHPAGPDAGVEAAAIERHRQQVMRERPEINKMIKAGDIDGAVQRLIDLGESRQSIKNIIESQLSPQKGAKSISSKFGKIATPEDRERAEEVNQ